MKTHYVTPDEKGVIAWPTLRIKQRSVITVGTFDGVHLGHQSVLRRTVDLAKSYGSLSVAILFDPRPALVHSYAAAHDGAEIPEPEATQDDEVISSVDQRIKWIEALGIEHLIVVHYNVAFGSQSYMFFLGQLTAKLGMRTLVLGADARLGAGRKGDIEAIDRLAQATRMFELDVVDDRGPGFTHVPNGEVNGVEVSKQVRIWSSSNVRHLLMEGDVAQAATILGRPHIMEGTVVHGEQRGRTLGYPTANLGGNVEGFMPADGVYSGWLVDCDDEGSELHRYPSAISIGTKLTFEAEIGKQTRLLEANAVTDEWIDIYGHHIRVEFIDHLRGQMKFASVDELIAQMKKDVAASTEHCGAGSASIA
ncbi:MAG: adenylyltransferase/cytidyltransferase family protein [Bifidobacteriaceae bacterium]|jgi:riboflavin kinase/FMN adenylyltransferase|nr:adenylyltransferase/cytidyltransferase family protein [Bifidobacteriaceae bacterium]MCI1915527.1 adenylyltransferase/cytidyltransferase family protein [Bifidobacteriaceae bacterium]